MKPNAKTGRVLLLVACTGAFGFPIGFQLGQRTHPAGSVRDASDRVLGHAALATSVRSGLALEVDAFAAEIGADFLPSITGGLHSRSCLMEFRAMSLDELLSELSNLEVKQAYDLRAERRYLLAVRVFTEKAPGKATDYINGSETDSPKPGAVGAFFEGLLAHPGQASTFVSQLNNRVQRDRGYWHLVGNWPQTPDPNDFNELPQELSEAIADGRLPLPEAKVKDLFWRGFASRDPIAAIAALSRIEDRGLRDAIESAAVSVAAHRAPDRALRELRGLISDDSYESLISRAARVWADRSPKECINWLVSLPAQQQQRAFSEASPVLISQAPLQLMALADTLPAGLLSADQALQTAIRGASEDGERAISWLKDKHPASYAEGGASVAREWLVSDLDSAIEFLSTTLDSTILTEEVLRTAGAHLAAADGGATDRLLRIQRDGGAGFAVESYVEQLAWRDPTMAKRALAELGPLGSRTYAEIGRAIGASDFESALDWIDSVPEAFAAEVAESVFSTAGNVDLEQDAQHLSDWILSKKPDWTPSEDSVAAIKRFAESLTFDSQHTAVDWIQSLEGTSVHAPVAHAVMGKWIDVDPHAAFEAIRDLDSRLRSDESVERVVNGLAYDPEQALMASTMIGDESLRRAAQTVVISNVLRWTPDNRMALELIERSNIGESGASYLRSLVIVGSE